MQNILVLQKHQSHSLHIMSEHLPFCHYYYYFFKSTFEEPKALEDIPTRGEEKAYLLDEVEVGYFYTQQGTLDVPKAILENHTMLQGCEERYHHHLRLWTHNKINSILIDSIV